MVCPNLPYPPDEGVKIKLYNLIKNLSDKHNISLLCYAGSGDQEKQVSHMKAYCESIYLVQRKKISKTKQLPSIAKYLFLRLPWNVKYAKSKDMQDAILKITKANPFDILHIDDVFMASNLDLSSHYSFKKAITFQDIESINYRRTFKIEKNPYQKMLFLLNWLAMRSWERKIIENFDLTVTVSPIELRILESMYPKANIAFIPNGVDIESFNPLPVTDNEDSLLFIGKMDYSPNIDGAVYFAKRIFPLIKREIPNTKLMIVGQNPKKALEKLKSDPSVSVTGYVESVIPYYKRSSVAIVPLRAGGGTRGKILEAMALGRPVVSTSLGAEGLEATHKENIMIADKDEDFARYVIDLMKNMSLRKNLIEKAREFVEARYDWREVAKGLDRAYREMFLKS